MSRLPRILLASIIGIILLFPLAWLGLAAYLHFNQAKVLAEVNKQINENIRGAVTIGKMETSLLRGFPGVGVVLQDVVVRDSLWANHRHDLLNVKYIYVSISSLSLIKNEPVVDDIRVSDGQIYIYNDTSGYSNTNIFHSKKDTAKNTVRFDELELKNILFTFENKAKFKLFRLDIRQLASEINYNAGGWTMENDLDMLVKDFTFNTEKGSFLKNKRVSTDIRVQYDEQAQVLTIPAQQILIDKDKLTLGGKFSFGDTMKNFSLNIRSKGIAYKNATALVSPNISKKLKLIDLQKPVTLEADLQGRMKFRDTPLVHMTWKIVNNTLTTPAGKIENCSFEGSFNNEYQKASGRNDKNSAISLSYVKGKWEDISFQAKDLRAVNLIDPYVSGNVKSSFALSKLNQIIGTRTFVFSDGKADVDVSYKGYISEASTVPPDVSGSVKITGAGMRYVPRGLSFNNSTVTLSFGDGNLYLKQAALHSGKSTLNISGAISNFFNLYYSSPDKMLIDCKVTSPEIDLSEFLAFVGKRQAVKQVAQSPYARIDRIAQRLDMALDQSSARLQLNVAKLHYKKFDASDIAATVTLVQSGLTLSDVRVKHAGGALKLNAHIDQNSSVNQFTLKTSVEHINVQEFFTSFGNFGQDAIVSDNIRGILTADVNMKGSMRGNGQVIPSSFNGTVNVHLVKGALLNFQPFQKIGKLVFRNRDMTNVTFGDLSSRLDINGDKITISPTHIASSVLTADVDGIYALNTGNDLNIVVSLRNPRKDELVIDEELQKERSMKGILVRLKGVDGEDGNVKIKFEGLGKDKRGK